MAMPADARDTPTPQPVDVLTVAFENAKGESGRLFLNGQGLSRLELDRHNAHYLLLDLAGPDGWMVDMGRQVVTNGQALLFSGDRVPLRVVDTGPGPERLGVPTRRVSVRDMDDRHCATYLIAETLAERDQRLRATGRFLARLAVSPREILPALGPLAAGLISSCVRAELDALPALVERGLPVQRANAEGKITFQVTMLEERTLEPCLLTLPKTYSRRTPAQVAVEAIRVRLFGKDKPDTDKIRLDQCPP
ncbi:MAG: hypothetical protein ACP5DC_09650 [Halothiobacillaceae bacterium]